MKTLIEIGTTDQDGLAVGRRTQVAVSDFNNDGKLDLIVGDYNRPPLPEISKEAKEELATIRDDYYKLIRANSGLQRDLKKIDATKLESSEIEEASDEKESATEESCEDLAAKGKRLRAELAANSEKSAKMLEEMQRLQPRPKLHGYVWFFEQQ